jgi:type I restriction-modification system DNA methylase subunit
MAGRQLPLPFGPTRNRNLLSNHWLEHRLCLEPEWTDFRSTAKDLLVQLGRLWREERERVSQYAEANLEQAFIQPILTCLGWKFLYQTSLRGRKPDYALFLRESDYDAALAAGRTNIEFWRHAALVGDAKAWAANLDRPIRVENQREYPPEQIEWYIQRGATQYGLLTNGRIWRLYPHKLAAHQPRFETYLEYDLGTLLTHWVEAGDGDGQRTFSEDEPLINEFLKFYLFFSPVGFAGTEERKPLIDRAVEGSNVYRLGIGEGLKSRVFQALQTTIRGFLSCPRNGLDPDRDLSQCRDQSLVLLYRLLFVMYAEDRDLLPYRSNRLYRENRSLSRLRDQLAGQIDDLEEGRGQDFDSESFALWDDLTSLFDLVDRGGKRYGVPAYNGGLFDDEESPFLVEKVLSDWHLARVIDQLSRAVDEEHPEAGLFRVDYRDLSIQHLGHVYEGLLELRPRRATEPMLVVRKRGRQGTEQIILAADPIPAGCERTGETCAPGEVFLATDKGERRASGSYYTPNHIVDYIVQQTLGPVCRQVGDQLRDEVQAAEKQLKRARGHNRELLEEKVAALHGDFDDRVLRLKVLDPAMGSGHFLLRACQYLAEEIATNPHAADPEAEHFDSDESTLSFWKRRVVEHCLYGVDMNPLAVELAKVALWLETAAINYPLTFLDHHLRCGNSLVGAKVEDLGSLPGNETLPLFEQQVLSRMPTVLDGLKVIVEKPSDTVEQVKEKTKVFRAVVDAVRKPFIVVADLWCATFFLQKADQIIPSQYAKALETIGSRNNHARLRRESWFQKALDAAADVSCFHWELEFPEVFFDQTTRREGAGFDVIIGNPPYDVLSEKETGHDLTNLKEFLKAQPVYDASFRGKNNLYKLFVCRVIDLLLDGGRLGLITPMAILGDDQAASLRRRILDLGAFTSVDALPQKDDPTRRVFAEAKLSTAVFSLIKTGDPETRNRVFVSRVHPAQYTEPDSPSLSLSTTQIPLYDPSNVTIVSCSQHDWDLAVRIMRSGRMIRLGEVAEFFQGEVNETNERARGSFVGDPAKGKLVVRGACICLYITRAASQGTDLHLDVTRFLQGKGRNTKAYHHEHRRIGLQESCPQNNFRRIIAGIVPRGEFCNHKVNYLPEFACLMPLEVNLAILNSKLSDWYFRLGSTNAAVSHYQLYNLPCPIFAQEHTDQDKELQDSVMTLMSDGNHAAGFEVVRPALERPPFLLAVRDVIVELVRNIMAAEERRGDIARSERSALCAEAQPYQDLIDRLLYAMAGLSDEEAHGLEERLARML